MDARDASDGRWRNEGDGGRDQGATERETGRERPQGPPVPCQTASHTARPSHPSSLFSNPPLGQRRPQVHRAVERSIQRENHGDDPSRTLISLARPAGRDPWIAKRAGQASPRSWASVIAGSHIRSVGLGAFVSSDADICPAAPGRPCCLTDPFGTRLGPLGDTIYGGYRAGSTRLPKQASKTTLARSGMFRLVLSETGTSPTRTVTRACPRWGCVDLYILCQLDLYEGHIHYRGAMWDEDGSPDRVREGQGRCRQGMESGSGRECLRPGYLWTTISSSGSSVRPGKVERLRTDYIKT